MQYARDIGCPDDSFGPWAGPVCRGGFDFTLLFEETIMCILLQSIFIMCLPIRGIQLARSSSKVAPGPILPLKVITSLSLTILNIALIALWSKTGDYTITHTRASIASSSLTFVASIGVCVLSWLEHERSFKPSFLLSLYLYISVLLDLARTRTLWMLGNDRTIPAIFTCTLALRVVLVLLESVQKRSLLPARDKACSPEATRGLASTAAFAWLFPLLSTGYKKVFAVDDLYPVDDWLQSKPLYETLREEWEKVPNKAAPNALMFTWIRVFAGTFWAPAMPRLFVIAFTYAQPFLIQSAVEFASTPRGMPYDNYGYGLIGAFVLVYAGQAASSSPVAVEISVGQYYWRLRRMISVTRGGIIGLIYKESLLLDLNAPGANPLAAVTHANGDTDAAQQALYQAHDLWSSIIEIIVADYLIWRQIGAACAIPIAVAVAALAATSCIAAPSGTALGVWLLALQQRIIKTSQTLASIKWIKMSGLGDAAFTSIRDLRTHELKVSQKYRLLVGGSMIIMIFAPIWSPILTFSLYAGRAEKDSTFLSPALVFTSYSLISLLNGPISTLTMTLPVVAGGMAAFQRIQNFLNGARLTDKRNMVDESKSSIDKTGSEKATGLNSNGEKRAAMVPGSHPHSEDSQVLESNSSLQSRQALDERLIATVQGKYRWTAEAEPVIDIDEFNLQRHKVTVVLGPVGCGKSTLLKSLLGELSSFEGTIRTGYSGVAYCDQNPWIPNGTVRDVITGHGDYDESWYRRVIKATELEHDLQAWPRGDKTSTASTGLALSGGQKQRLALARALYSGKELIVLDDVFKALDATTEMSILENLWGSDGLLRTGEMTTVLASSDEKHVAYAEKVVALNEKGQVKATGTSEEVAAVLGIIISKGNPHSTQGKDDTSALQTESAPAQIISETVDDEFTDPTRRLGTPGTFREYVSAAGWPTMVLVLLSLSVYAFCGSFPTIWLGWWADEAVIRPSTPIGKWLGVYVALGVGSLLGAAFSSWLFMVVIINKCGIAFHESLLKTVSRAPMSFFSTVDAGTTLNRFSEDIRMIDMEIPSAAFGIGTTAAFLLAQFIIMAYITKYIAVVLPVLIIFFYVMQHFYLRTSRQLRVMDIELKAPIVTKLVEVATGLVSIRAFQWGDRVMDEGMAVLDNSQRPCYLLGSVQCWLNFAVEMLMMLLALLFIVITTLLRQNTGAVNMGVGLSSLLAISTSAKLLINFWVMLENALGAIARVSRFTKVTKLEQTTAESSLDLNDKSWPRAGAIELCNVTASYSPAKTCLENISLYIPAGQKIAICGRTGSGKSSLILSFLRMLELDSGSILIDGVDISTLPHDYLRTRIVASPQETYIMDSTVRYNADPSATVSDAEIQVVLERVQLWSKIGNIGGLDAVIGQGLLSPGEAQLLVLARAMLRKSRILLLDEPSGSLDATATELIGHIIRDWFQSWTVISITHDLSSLTDYDAVVTLDNGRLVGYGPPQASGLILAPSG